MATAPLRIAIVGGGPAGLTLAALLHKQGLPFTVFELRAKPTEAEFDQPVGSLDLHEGTGLAAIRELDLFEEFKTMTDDCTEDMLVADRTGNVVFHHGADGNGAEPRPEISRNKLNQLLLGKIPASSIQWQRKLLGVRRCTATSSSSSSSSIDSTEVELDFGDHGKQAFDLVIGADGAWSKIRHLLTDVKPRYAGRQILTADIRHITTKHPRLAKLVGTGTYMCFGDRHVVVSQRAAQDSARIYLMISTDDKDFSRTQGLLRDKMTAEEMIAFLFERDAAPLKNFGPAVKELVGAAYADEEASNPACIVDIRPMYTLHTVPGGMRWDHHRGFGATLIGDAAHVMPPNGEGVNIAMKDALEVSKAIVEAHRRAEANGVSVRDELDTLIKGFEDDMFARAEEVAQDTEQLFDIKYGSDDAAKEVTDFFKSFAHDETPEAVPNVGGDLP